MLTYLPYLITYLPYLPGQNAYFETKWVPLRVKKPEPANNEIRHSETPRLRDSELPEDGRRAAIDDQRTVIVARRLWLADVKAPLCLLTYLPYLPYLPYLLTYLTYLPYLLTLLTLLKLSEST